jgi:hypothetical protein
MGAERRQRFKILPWLLYRTVLCEVTLSEHAFDQAVDGIDFGVESRIREYDPGGTAGYPELGLTLDHNT